MFHNLFAFFNDQLSFLPLHLLLLQMIHLSLPLIEKKLSTLGALCYFFNVGWGWTFSLSIVG
jgi:hypothetical protein